MHHLRVLSTLLVLILPAALAAGCELETEQPSVESGSGEGGGNSDGGPKVAKVGDKVTLEGTTYQVTEAETAQSLGDASIGLDVQANGTFVIVRLSLTNKKDEPATILEDNIRLIGGNGKNYSTSDDAIFALGDEQTFIFEEIQPDNTEKGTLVYDVPASAVTGAKLQVEDLFSDSKARIRLGLRGSG